MSAMAVVAFTTLFLFGLTLFVGLKPAFSWVFFLTVFGQGLVVFMVYKVLTDDYKTDKTFRHGYQDRSLTEDLE